MSTTPQIVAIAPGPPRDRLTWSGISHHVLTALERPGALAGAVDGRHRMLERAEAAAGLSTSKARWRQRYHANSSIVSPVIRGARTALAAARLRAADVRPDAVLQFGVWYDGTRVPGLGGALRCTYQDGNLMTFLSRPDLALDRESPLVRHTLAYERAIQGRMDLVFTMSDWVRTSMVEDYGLDPAKVVNVGAGANLDRLPELPRRAPGPPRLLFVGKRFDRKGGPQLLEAFRRVRAQRPDAELWIVGPSEPLEPQDGVTSFGLIRRDTPAGEAEIDRLYREATAFVLPSIHEPFGIAFLEAMSYGLPCVGSSSCAMPEIIADGVTGFVAPPGDVDALADRLLELIADPARTRAMGEAAHARLHERFTWDRVAERMVAAVAERAGARG